MAIPNSKKCPCGKDKTYLSCCAKGHQNHSKISSAEDLMRSRYSAFVKGNGEYLNLTHHTETRDESEKENIEKWARSVKWIKLEVLNSTLGSIKDKEGTVEFKAHFKQGLFSKVIHEKSRFIKVDKLWFYHSAL